MSIKKKSRTQWPEPDLDPDQDSSGNWSRLRIDPDERDDYEDWREERVSRGRKRRDKAGGRHERRRRKSLED
jgi:hypothetical protein